jgi:hypothetical protein
MLELGGSRYRPDALLGARETALRHRTKLLETIRERPETAGMAVFLYQAELPGELEQTLERLAMWLRCLAEAHEEYAAGRRSSEHLL